MLLSSTVVIRYVVFVKISPVVIRYVVFVKISPVVICYLVIVASFTAVIQVFVIQLGCFNCDCDLVSSCLCKCYSFFLSVVRWMQLQSRRR